ncbi:serine-tRNA(Ala) deacylase AlaX [Aneurinibacillus tyrosinisolvens]|jgi:alanyl-tRNA synthetase|uniref:serine-tRNA(Ala) deacylase AlaX n=1 Tax=Aneurinibacillus tyrosinisolvens TaxID=1443435 RepID=UPI00063F037B|nr:serine-tRNA(Ala) deacylase AlaX [Aneurinibacillus tyrosinisolvens]
MKDKLYYEDPYKKEFTASILRQGTERDGTPFVVLTQTAFYPTGGGQPCDLGTLSGIDVIDVEEIEGEIRHRLRGALPEDKSEIAGKIDWQRRFDHMQQHTGQHILSAAFEQLYDAATVGFHLGRETVTVDIALPELSREQAEAVEQLANSIVFENRDIIARFVEPQELAQLPLRKPPSVSENVRIVMIADFDYSPCGGTHPSRTGEVGPIKILTWERYKNNNRIEFVCGARTIREMNKKQMILRDASRLLTSGEAELADNVTRLLTERKELERSLLEARGKLFEYEAGELVEAAPLNAGIHLVTKTFTDRTMQDLQKLANHVTSIKPNTVALFAGYGDKTQLVFARGSAVPIAMNNLLKETLPLIDGKGGGNPNVAQGGGNMSVSAGDVVAYAERILKESLSSN